MIEHTDKHCKKVLKGFILPGLPHPLLAPEKNPAWMKVKQGYEKVKAEIDRLKPDLLLIYSTYWASILGHQIQAHPNPKWILVDDEWHELGSIPYELKIDSEFAMAYDETCKERGLYSRTVAYDGFPIDTGSVVCSKLLNPDNKIPACIVSSNIYSDRAEQLIFGKAAADALERTGKTAVVISISSLSNRYIQQTDYLKQERINSKKDEEWNKKFLEFFEKGRLEDISQLSRQFHREARVTRKVNNYKPFWWLAAVMGETNAYKGEIYEYQPIHGTGAAIIGLTPTSQPAPDLEFDEDQVDVFEGDRGVLSNQNTPMMEDEF